MSWTIEHADCIEAMREMDEASVDAVVCDPPYGLEFMGRDWDKLDYDLPQENVWKGRRGKGGSNIGTDDSKPGSRHHVALGMGKRHQFKRCTVCGKRQFSGSPCECDEPEWVIETPPGTPSSSLRAQRWHQAWATEALRVLKPGGYLLAFGGTRTYHRLACAVEDAGFEIRDSLIWLYGSGFPKSLDVSKAIDKAAGAEREVVGQNPNHREAPEVEARWNDAVLSPDLTAPATPEAQKWNGWGTALKPAHEPIVVARKPLIGTVAQNVQEHGTGALNIDGCRIGTDGGGGNGLGSHFDRLGNTEPLVQHGEDEGGSTGRWPANVAFSPEAAAELDRQSGERPGSHDQMASESANGWFGQASYDGRGFGDTGGASRFFYVAKASRAERNAGLEGFESRYGEGDGVELPERLAGGMSARQDGSLDGGIVHARNHHPTVKPIALMRWLCRLVIPPDGTILDPFVGSGTTGIAAVLEGFDFIGIEREAEYVEIARARIDYYARQPKQLELA